MPESLQGWTPESGGRGTWSIIWTCLSTIFIAIWVSFHPNLPIATSTGKRLLHRLGWLFTAVLLPELVATEAYYEYCEMRALVKEMKRRNLHCTSIQGFYTVMGGYAYHGSRTDPRECLTPKRYLWLLEKKIIMWPVEPKGSEEVPPWYMTDEMIKDKSKADPLVKLVAVIQILAFTLTCILRGAHSLPLSPLEVTTLAYAFCMVIIYFFWWAKPYTVQTSTFLDLKHLSPTQLMELENVGNSGHLKEWRSSFLYTFGASTPLLVSKSSRKDYLLLSVFICFGALHCSDWMYTFPTYAESFLWKICACLVTFNPFIAFILYFLLLPRYLEYWAMFITPVLYVIARLYLIVEAFISLRAAPATIYDTWEVSNYIFHFF